MSLDPSLTIPEALALRARNNASDRLFVFPKSLDGSDELVSVTMFEFARAVDRAAHLVRPSKAGKDNEVVAIIGQADILTYHTTTIGLMRANLIPFPISHRLSPEAIVSLLRKTNCHRMIVTRGPLETLFSAVEAELKEHHTGYDVAFEEIASLATLYPFLGNECDKDQSVPYPDLSQPADMESGGVYIHSSGSTGLPKAIHETNAVLSSNAGFPAVKEFPGDREDFVLSCTSPPPFHAMGLWLQVFFPLSCGFAVALPPQTGGFPVQPTPANILDFTVRTKSHALLIVPTFLQFFAEDPKALEVMRALDLVIYGGGPLATATGDFLVASGIKLRAVYGGTEFGPPAHLRLEPRLQKEWSWYRFSDRAKPRWVDQGDGTYELQLLTNPTHVLALENLEDTKGYATHDIFEKHPTEPGLWRIVGRKDDVLIHSSGEKTVPGPMERIIALNPIVKGVLMFGHNQKQPGVLIELLPDCAIDVNDPHQVDEMRGKLWPTIIQANTVAPGFSKLFRDFVLIASPEKPLVYGQKGHVVRKLALEQYKTEIQTIYDSAVADDSGVEPPPSWALPDVKTWLGAQVKDLLEGKEVLVDHDLFEQGLDSLSSTVLRNKLAQALRETQDESITHKISQNTLYSYPTINLLAGFVVGLVGNTSSVATRNHEDLMLDMIDKYSGGWDGVSPPRASTTRPERAVILITGTTGNLGADLLASSIEANTVERVYAFNRPYPNATSVQRHEERFTDKGLDPALLSSPKVHFLEGDLAKPLFGLNQETYDKLKDEVSVIIHNSWRLDFNLPLASFENHVVGSKNLMDLAREGKYGASTRFLFTSSIGSAQSWDPSLGPFPETLVEDPKYAAGSGYGEGKYVTERILARSGIRGTSFRIGQICGGRPNGAWAMSDWVPIMLQTSLTLGLIPDSAGLASWIQGEAVCGAIMDFALADWDTELPFATNIVHPRPISWSQIIQYLQNAVESHGRGKLTAASWTIWMQELERFQSRGDVKALAGLKLFDFFRNAEKSSKRSLSDADSESMGLATMETATAQKFSPTMKNLIPLDAGDVERWVSYWLERGL